MQPTPLAKGLTEEVRNSLVTVSSMLSEVEQQQQQQSRQNIVAAEGSGCAGRPRLEITAEQLELGLPLLQDAVNAVKFVVACQ